MSNCFPFDINKKEGTLRLFAPKGKFRVSTFYFCYFKFLLAQRCDFIE